MLYQLSYTPKPPAALPRAVHGRKTGGEATEEQLKSNIASHLWRLTLSDP
jgi:hypothetical protein